MNANKVSFGTCDGFGRDTHHRFIVSDCPLELVSEECRREDEEDNRRDRQQRVQDLSSRRDPRRVYRAHLRFYWGKLKSSSSEWHEAGNPHQERMSRGRERAQDCARRRSLRGRHPEHL